MDTAKRSQIGVESAINRDWSTYGIEPPRPGYVAEDEESNNVELYDVHIEDTEEDITSILSREFDPNSDIFYGYFKGAFFLNYILLGILEIIKN